MILKLLLIGLFFQSWLVLAKPIDSVGCAKLTLSEQIARKVASIRAQAQWVKQHHGSLFSGKESLLLENNTSQLTQEIMVKSAGQLPSQAALNVKQYFRKVDGETLLCIHLSTK